MEDTFKTDPPFDWHGNPEAQTVLPAAVEDAGLTSMPPGRAVMKLALPAISSMLLIMIFNLVDAWWVSKLGAEPFAGVSAASFMFWALQSMSLIISEGVNALVARFVGAKRNSAAGRVVGQAMILAVVIALMSTVLGLRIVHGVFTSMGLEGVVLDSAVHYMSYTLYGLVIIFLAYTLDAAFRGMGDTRTPLMLIGAGLLLNMILDPLFIFGIGPFPRMEAAGAALATVIAHVLVLVAAIIAIQGRVVHIRFSRQEGRIVDFSMMWRIFKIGAPLALSGLLFSLSYMMLTKIISMFGTSAIAALGLGHRIEGISYNVAVGFSLAAATLVGQNLGAGKPEGAEKAVWSTILYVSIFLFVVSLFFYFCGGLVIGFFIKDHQVIQEGFRYLKIIAVFEIFLGFEIVFEGAFSGAGNTIPPMLISVPLTWARIPLALLLADRWGWGSMGIWWAISLTTGLKGITMALWFRRGRWKHKRV